MYFSQQPYKMATYPHSTVEKTEAPRNKVTCRGHLASSWGNSIWTKTFPELLFSTLLTSPTMNSLGLGLVITWETSNGYDPGVP